MSNKPKFRGTRRSNDYDLRMLAINNAQIDKERKSRAAKMAARLAERDRAYATHIAENGIPYETTTHTLDGIIVRRRGQCTNYGGEWRVGV